jgi:DNA-binding NarL/FixJ family response regulator
MALVVRGLSNAEVRKELYLSEPTVKTHVGRILMKLGARDRVQLVVLAYEHGRAGEGLSAEHRPRTSHWELGL